MNLKQIKYRARPGGPMPKGASLETKQMISQLREDSRVLTNELEKERRLLEMYKRHNEILNDRLAQSEQKVRVFESYIAGKLNGQP